MVWNDCKCICGWNWCGRSSNELLWWDEIVAIVVDGFDTDVEVASFIPIVVDVGAVVADADGGNDNDDAGSDIRMDDNNRLVIGLVKRCPHCCWMVGKNSKIYKHESANKCANWNCCERIRMLRPHK